MRHLALAALIALASLFLGCSAVSQCKDTESTKCTAVNAVVDCASSEVSDVVSEFTPVVTSLISSATGADGSVDWSTVESSLTSLSATYGQCILAEIIGDLLTSKSKLATGEVRPSADALQAGLAHARVTLWKLPADTRVHTRYGDL